MWLTFIHLFTQLATVLYPLIHFPNFVAFSRILFLILEFYLRQGTTGHCVEYSKEKYRAGFNCVPFILYQNHFMHFSKQCLKIIPSEKVELWECSNANVETMKNAGIDPLLKEKHIFLNMNQATGKIKPIASLVKVYRYSTQFGMRTLTTGRRYCSIFLATISPTSMNLYNWLILLSLILFSASEIALFSCLCYTIKFKDRYTVQKSLAEFNFSRSVFRILSNI